MGGFIIQKYLEIYNAPAAVLMASVAPFGVWAGVFGALKFPWSCVKVNLTLILKYFIPSSERFSQLLLATDVPDEDVELYYQPIGRESIRA